MIKTIKNLIMIAIDGDGVMVQTVERWKVGSLITKSNHEKNIKQEYILHASLHYTDEKVILGSWLFVLTTQLNFTKEMIIIIILVENIM